MERLNEEAAESRERKRERRGRKGKRGKEGMEGRRRWRGGVKGHVVALSHANKRGPGRREGLFTAGSCSLSVPHVLPRSPCSPPALPSFISFHRSFVRSCVLRCSLQLETSSESMVGIT